MVKMAKWVRRHNDEQELKDAGVDFISSSMEEALQVLSRKL
jgi:hypothetical protein